MRRKLLVSLAIGVIAGLVDITPGVIRGVDFRITLTGFSFWVVLGPTIAFVSLPLSGWVKGLIVASLLAIPGTILMSVVDPASVVPMLFVTFALGSLVGFLTGKFAK